MPFKIGIWKLGQRHHFKHHHDPSCDGDVYFCPSSGETECAQHGGFSTCCSTPELHSVVSWVSDAAFHRHLTEGAA